MNQCEHEYNFQSSICAYRDYTVMSKKVEARLRALAPPLRGRGRQGAGTRNLVFTLLDMSVIIVLA